MKVGIDLSSSNTGVVILENNNHFIARYVFNLWDNDYNEIYKNCYAMCDTITDMTYPRTWEVKIGIELADFRSAKLTNRFNLLTGMIIAIMNSFKIDSWTPDIKLFNSNEWWKFVWDMYKQKVYFVQTSEDKVRFVISCIAPPHFQGAYTINDIPKKSIKNGKIPREVRKLVARIFSMEHCLEYNDNWTEDECDAYCITYFLPQLRDRTQIHQEVKTKKVQEKKSKVQELRAKASKEHKISKLKDIVIKYKSMSKLTKAQQRALEKAENELKELNNEKIS